jgi:hypothetical protein
MSWWPTDSAWQQFAPYTRWSEKVDGWYNNRLQEIKSGKGGPLGANKWRQEIRGSSTLRRIDGFVTEAYDRFVDGHVTA